MTRWSSRSLPSRSPSSWPPWAWAASASSPTSARGAVGALLAMAVALAACDGGGGTATTSPSPDATMSVVPGPSPSATTDLASPSPSPSPSPSSSPSSSPGSTTTVPLYLVQRHPSGVTMHLRSLADDGDGVGLEVSVTNGSRQESVLAFQPADVTLVDDTGAALEFRPPSGNEQLRVAEGDELSGTLAFAGELGDGATTATIRFNFPNGRPVNLDLPVSEITSFEFTDVPLTPVAGGAATAAPTESATARVRVGRTERHPGGVLLRIRRITTDGDAIRVAVRAVNRDDNEPTNLAVEAPFTFLEDDLGTRYPLSQQRQDQLRLEPGEELVGDLGFVGPLEPDATGLTLYVNFLNPRTPINLDGELSPQSASFLVEDLPVPE